MQVALTKISGPLGAREMVSRGGRGSENPLLTSWKIKANIKSRGAGLIEFPVAIILRFYTGNGHASCLSLLSLFHAPSSPSLSLSISRSLSLRLRQAVVDRGKKADAVSSAINIARNRISAGGFTVRLAGKSCPSSRGLIYNYLNGVERRGEGKCPSRG